MGFGKKHGFYKQKGKTKDKLQASFFKERYPMHFGKELQRRTITSSDHHKSAQSQIILRK